MTNTDSNPNSARPEGAGEETALLASGLSALALVLFAYFMLNVSSQAVPLRVAVPAWQLRFAQGAIAAAPMPLIGLGLLQLATYIDSGNLALAARRRTLSSFAILAVVGFLLLIPLQLFAASGSIREMNTVREAKMQQVHQNIDQLRLQIQAAGSLEDLQARIKAIQAPDLILDASSLGQPLPQIKQALLASVDRSESQLNRAIGSDSPRRLWAVLQRSMQGVLSCLALAFGFAALARRSNSDLSLLQELRSGWKHSKLARLEQRRAARRKGMSDEEYLRQLSGKEPEP